MCKMKTARLAFVLLALLLAAAAARAQGQNSIEGRVLLPSGAQPAQPVRVTLTLGGRHVYETFTDLSGRFSFPGLRGGAYRLTAEGDGRAFETTSVQVEVSSMLGGGQAVTQNIQLRPKSGAPAPPAYAVDAEELDPGVPDAAREKFRRGLKSAAEGKPEQAVRALEEAVRAHANFYAAQMALAEQLSMLRRYDEALAAYRKASELRPERADPYVGVGVTLVGLKRYDEGIKMLRGLIEVDKNLAAPYLSLGYAEMLVGDHEAAREHLLRALELGKSPLARIYLANVYEQTGRPAEAAAQLEAYLKENPGSPQKEGVRAALDKLRKKAVNRKP
ncbi:MAG TPA: tetratricopeptide repeat protein [Pyrinomonadaceae bacterium]|jgi:tetratricopeptide (TPR) repeat protein